MLSLATEGVLNAPGSGGSDALVDQERLPQVRDGLARVMVLEVALADSFQTACFPGEAKVANDRERFGVTFFIIVLSQVQTGGQDQKGSNGRQIEAGMRPRFMIASRWAAGRRRTETRITNLVVPMDPALVAVSDTGRDQEATGLPRA